MDPKFYFNGEELSEDEIFDGDDDFWDDEDYDDFWPEEQGSDWADGNY